MLLGRFRKTSRAGNQNMFYGNDDDDVNILGGNVYTIKRSTQTLVVASKKIGLEINAEKTKYVIMSRDQAVGTDHNIKIDYKSLEKVEHFKYLGTTLTNSNSIHEEIKSKLKSGYACYNLVRIFSLPVCHPKYMIMNIHNSNFACCFVWM